MRKLCVALFATFALATPAEAKVIDASSTCEVSSPPIGTLPVQRCQAEVRVGRKPVAWITAPGFSAGSVHVSVFRVPRRGVSPTIGLFRQWKVVGGRVVVLMRQRIYRRVPVRVIVSGPVGG